MFKIYVTHKNGQRVKLAEIDTNNMQMINCIKELLFAMKEGGMLNNNIKDIEIML